MRTTKRKEIHVVPSAKGGWDSKRKGALWASRHFETKSEAMDWSRKKAKEEGAELIPHKKNGRIQNPNSFGSDPVPPRDKKN